MQLPYCGGVVSHCVCSLLFDFEHCDWPCSFRQLWYWLRPAGSEFRSKQEQRCSALDSVRTGSPSTNLPVPCVPGLLHRGLMNLRMRLTAIQCSAGVNNVGRTCTCMST